MIYFITGGSRGIGAAVVLQAVKEGHDVAFTYVSQEAQAQQVCEQAARIRPGVKCRPYRLDVTNSADVEQVGDRVADDFGTVHVVVPNAGINANALAVSMSDEDWHRVLQTNLTGAFYVCRQFLPCLLENRYGRLVFISSLSRDGLSGQCNYASAKAGLLGLSGTLAKEYGPKGITSNVVAPGFIETDMTRDHMSEFHSEHWLKYCPGRRLGRVEEVASLVTFLGSEASSYISGTCIPVTAGLDWAP